MTKLAHVEDAYEMVDQIVQLFLTLEAVRDQKHMVFLNGFDCTGSIQMIAFKKNTPEVAAELSQLLVGSVLEVVGKIVKSPQSKTNGVELVVEAVAIHSCSQARPINEDSSLEQRFNFRVVDLKSKRNQLMMQIRSIFENGCRVYALRHNAVEIHTPKLMGGASESGSEVFKVKYFDGEAFLAQSPQFYKQMAIASGLDAVFEIGPVFRAEQSNSSRHMTEFTGLDVELGWAKDLDQVIAFETGMLVWAFHQLEPFADRVKELFGVDLPSPPSIRKITLADAKTLLGLNPDSEDDLTDENERELYNQLKTDLIFVTDYPISKRPFYHRWDNKTGTTKSFDLIFKGIEITTGALREHRLDVLTEQAIAKGIDPAHIDDYLNNFRYGCPPHGGFGLGVERVIAKLLGLSNVKEAAFVPRDPQRLTP